MAEKTGGWLVTWPVNSVTVTVLVIVPVLPDESQETRIIIKANINTTTEEYL
jgi:hypothetical protein